ncbi:methylated-DNA--[protein]-cysteine S-methyltransferase [Canibacter zhoujuaniae]|uniref:methylated-DNA--[protein]-cysteine S-methyltransferase n=1 Tax=Canibacter zhoujuaniae TaxID=2708343 RepID=UPI00141F1B49|nr:methylated-DNA--[protein]-cysteine S-methyltransferase [Canibacter zhoujuaniae]
MARLNYCEVESPIGQLLLIAYDENLVRIGLDAEDFVELRAAYSRKYRQTAECFPATFADAVAQLKAYFAGELRTFSLPVDFGSGSGFRLAVQRFLPQIEYGQTLSYGQIAECLGNPGAARAVGTACALNPLPIVVPCHRVVRADGNIGRYAGGVAAKQFLLRLESAVEKPPAGHL